MSVNMDRFDDRDVDYASFEYEHLDFVTTLVNPEEGGSASVVNAKQVEPVEAIGGLDTNEVAELVGMRRTVHIEPDNFTDTSPVVNGNIEHRGTFGSDLNSASETVTGGQAVGDDNTLSQDQVSSAGGSISGQVNSAIFDHFDYLAHPGFDSQLLETPQPASGGGNYNTYEREINFRDLLGAGPVMDASDNMTLVDALISNNIRQGEIKAHYRATLIWDTAEVDDAGRRFGIPDA